MTRANVVLWGRQIGAVLWDADRGLGAFEYVPAFTRSDIEVAPFMMPLRPGIFEFPALRPETFHGLPGMLADSLPDRFGNALIDRWLVEQGRAPESFDPVERLCYTGRRGIGALEYEPAIGERRADGRPVDIAPLVELASRALAARGSLEGILRGRDDHETMREILRVGTSAGGARAKAVLAWNEATGDFHSGQLLAGPGYTQWIMKFDGVTGADDREIGEARGYGRLEYACYLVARAAGVRMMESRLHEEGGRAHFMTRRFDRTDDGRKLHMQSLCALRHFDFNQPRAYGYEQAIETIRRLRLGRDALVEQVRRAFLNVVIRNQDDHTKNIAFLMDRDGQWSLAPAFDVTYAYNPAGTWTSQHQMSLAGRTDGFAREDLMAFGRFADLKPAETAGLLDEVLAAAALWDAFAAEAGVPAEMAARAKAGFRRF